MKKDIFRISTISIFFLFLLMLWSMGPWFAWNHTEIMITALSICFLLCRFVLFTKNYEIDYSSITIIAFAFLVFFMVYLRFRTGIIGIINFIRIILVFTFVIMMGKDETKKIVTLTTIIYSWIVGISLAAYLLVVFAGVELPYSIINISNDSYYPPFRNYRLFIMLTDRSVFFQRFQSVFTEPGHLGWISALLLYINKYEFKKKSVLVIFISLLMSLSLAGYVLLILGYLIKMIAKSKNFFGTILKIFLVFAVLCGTGIYYYTKYPNSLFSGLILTRFELDEDRGVRGNNRTTGNFDYRYKTQFLTSTENILWGKKMDEFEYMVNFGRGGNNSYKVFLYRYGSVSLIFLFFLYFSIVAIKPSRLGFGLLLLYCASFLQRTQLWDMQMFLFVGAIQYFYTESNNRLTNETIK
jgi:hypothetical protein